MRPDVECLTRCANDLGESLTWDASDATLYWIDAWKSVVHAYEPATGEMREMSFAVPLRGRPIGSVARSGGGGMISGVKGGFYRLDLGRGDASLIAAVEADRPEANRLNDGKCDRAGRFWCASINTGHRVASGALWCLDTACRVRLMQDGLIAGNGIAWSPDDRTMYLADTLAGTVWQFDFDIVTGGIANRRVFLSADPAREAPDGATVDAEGCYWSALFRGGAVARFDPGGRLMCRIELPVANPTMCAFGGPDLDVLYVTSSNRFLDDAQRRKQPLAGRVFAVHGLGVRGLPEPRFGA